MKLKKGDTVKVIAGKDKGKTGTILMTMKDMNQVIIEGVNVATKHQKSKAARSQGRIIEKSMAIDASNVALMEGDKTVRIGYVFEGEGDKKKKVRVARPSGKKI